jgi:uncharacterized protein YecE (DUF72 family)
MLPDHGIHIGASGWSYPRGEGTWKGAFYPPGKIDELEYYSQFFNTVEVNSSFYRPPAPGIALGWARRVSAGFLFTVKLWQKFTHPAMFRQATGEDAVIAAADVDLFRAALEPLAASGKLGALLAQFPPSFKNDEDGRRVLAAVARAFGEYPLAVELRHRSWSDDSRTADFLREKRAAWVQIDEPKFAGSVAAELPVTAPLAYFRFHGRNAADWWTGDNETRYRYLYSPGEISGLAEKVKAAAAKAELLFAFFNNHWKAWAPRNANDMKRALQLPYRQLPLSLDIAEEEPKKA